MKDWNERVNFSTWLDKNTFNNLSVSRNPLNILLEN